MAHGLGLLSVRETRWALRRCARRGHILGHVANEQFRVLTGPVQVGPGGGTLLRCLRCGVWVDPDGMGVGELVGSPGAHAAIADLPLAVRGGHGRRIGLLKLVAVERFAKGFR